jgi:hypothetical protein
MGLKLFTIRDMGKEPGPPPSGKAPAKVPLQLRVAPETKARAEGWVRRYATKIKRPDVLRTILEMGLKAAKEANALDLSPDDDRPQTATSRRRT